MAGSADIVQELSTSDKFIKSFHNTLEKIDPDLSHLVDFKLQVQRKNLMSLVAEANIRIKKYENIYPYIKELCKDQTINPAMYKGIENVLNWALKKGRGKTRELSSDIKNAWITYIILLSCSMIDKDKDDDFASRNIFLRSDKGNIIGLTGSN